MDQHHHQWRRSSRCASGDSCVYVATAPGDDGGGDAGHVLVAESGDPGGRVLRVAAHAWAALVDEVKARRV
ncbi:DUF397 domain-containing protein [Streptomyces sp. NPDC002990]